MERDFEGEYVDDLTFNLATSGQMFLLADVNQWCKRGVEYVPDMQRYHLATANATAALAYNPLRPSSRPPVFLPRFEPRFPAACCHRRCFHSFTKRQFFVGPSNNSFGHARLTTARDTPRPLLSQQRNEFAP